MAQPAMTKKYFWDRLDDLTRDFERRLREVQVVPEPENDDYIEAIRNNTATLKDSLCPRTSWSSLTLSETFDIPKSILRQKQEAYLRGVMKSVNKQREKTRDSFMFTGESPMNLLESFKDYLESVERNLSWPT